MATLMIVDDEALARFSLRTIISQAFSDVKVVAEVETGEAAIDAFARFHPDVVLMDVRLPGMNGITASEKILERFPTAKIVILTAYDNFSFISRALEIGVKGFMLKPVSREEIVRKLGRFFAPETSIVMEMAQQKILEMMISRELKADASEELERYYPGLSAGMLVCVRAGDPEQTRNMLKALAARNPGGGQTLWCVADGVGVLFAMDDKNAEPWKRLLRDMAADAADVGLQWACDVVTNRRWYETYTALLERLRSAEDAASEKDLQFSVGERLREQLDFPDEEINDMSLNKLAERLGVSPQYLSAIFKDTMGVSFIGYITRRRMYYAARLLQRGEATIEKVARQCGYSDEIYFKRLFKKTFGISPREYARKKCGRDAGRNGDDHAQ